MPGMYVMTTYPEDMCTSDNMNYVEFIRAPLEALGVPFDECVQVGPSISAIYFTSSCATTGQLTASVYLDATCTEFYDTILIFDNNCNNDDDDDYDDDHDYDDDDDDDDDDDYELAGVIENQFCT
jgi:hypothetical protein